MANSLLPEITLDELSRLIRILGLLGSAHDGEILNAARLAQRWVVEHQTDWQTLLVPEPEIGVSGVVAAADPDRLEAATDSAYQQGHDAGYQAGMAAGLAKAMAQVKAQANLAAGRQAAHQGQPGWQSFNPHNPATWLNAGPGNPLGAPASAAGSSGAQSAQGPVRAPAAPPGGYPPSSWQAVAQELLDRDDAGLPGVLRSRERQFVSDVLSRGFPRLTQAQEQWLRDIARRNHMSW